MQKSLTKSVSARLPPQTTKYQFFVLYFRKITFQIFGVLTYTNIVINGIHSETKYTDTKKETSVLYGSVPFEPVKLSAKKKKKIKNK